MSNPQTTPLSTNSIEQTDITDKLSRQAPNATHYVVFDACRNELQLTKKERKALGQEKGFVPIAQTTGLLIAYATAPQQTASDAGGDSGPYAKEIVKPGVEAVTMFRNVQLRVKDAIGQDPWLTFPTLSAVYLAGQRATTTTDAPTLNLEDTQDAGELAAFISQMPDGPYRKLLQERLADLRIKTRPTCAGGRTWPPTNISVGAVQISSARAPWAAGLKLGGAGQCSATIVAANWAIAAGHCVTETKTQVVSGKTKIVGWEPRTPSDLKLIVGADDLDSASPAETISPC
jgi:hypothetical protein